MLSRSVFIFAIAGAIVTTSCSTDDDKSATQPVESAGRTTPTSEAVSEDSELAIGVIVDRTGPSALFGPPTVNVAELAVSEINAAGGVNGKLVSLRLEDGQTDPATSKAAAQRLVSEHGGVAALFTMFSSAQSAAVQPVTEEAAIPYFYTPVWQGEECLANQFANGEVPSQQLAPVIPWVQEQTAGDRWFLLGNDYVWPRTSFELAREYIDAAGGEVVGEEYVPLGTTDFSSVINKIAASGATLMIPALVGSDAVTFEKQAFDAGVGNDAVQRLAILYEDNTRQAMGADVTAGMFFSTGYDRVLDLPANRSFIEAYEAEFGADAPPVTTLSEHLYVAIKAWAAAATAAGSEQLDDIATAIVGLSLDTPGGMVSFLPNRYVTQTIHVVEVGGGGTAQVVTSFPSVDPQQECAVA